MGGVLQGEMRVAPNLYIGLEYRLIDMSTSLHVENPPFPDLALPPIELESKSAALGPIIEYDTRDDEFQPGKGLYIQGQWLWANNAFGGDFDYSRSEFKVNGYHRLSEGSVLAWRGSTCWAGDGAPFYDICNFGTQNDLRGYVSGQYRDRAMAAVQAEYRRHLFGRFGAVAFAGIGEVGESFGQFTSNDILPSVGLGLRFQASKKYKVNAAIDYGWGKDSSALLFHVGEAF
jgi:outer membrane protein assembly factor BamA